MTSNSARSRANSVCFYIRTRLHEPASNATSHKELVLRRALAEALVRKKWAGNASAIVPKIQVTYHSREVWLTEHRGELLLAKIAKRRHLWCCWRCTVVSV